jgi:hypothetical protein
MKGLLLDPSLMKMYGITTAELSDWAEAVGACRSLMKVNCETDNGNGKTVYYMWSVQVPNLALAINSDPGQFWNKFR